MVSLKDLSKDIINIVNKYQKDEEKCDTFPTKIEYENKKYYCFIFSESAEMLVVREDGVVPTFNDHVIKIALIAKNVDASAGTISNIGFKWAKVSMKKFHKLKELLNNIDNIIKHSANQEIDEKLKEYSVIPNVVIRNQRIIEESVQKCDDLINKTLKKEITSESDQKQIRKYIVDMTRAAYKQNNIQIETKNDREQILDYLSSIKFSSPKIFYYTQKLQWYEKTVFGSISVHTINEMKEIGEEISEDKPLEEDDEAQEVIRRIRNPRS